MPKKIDPYRVFIATPGGLDDERKPFRKTGRSEKYSGHLSISFEQARRCPCLFLRGCAEFDAASDADRRAWQVKALFNKGVTLGQLGRSEDAIAVYDDVIARFGAAGELALREQVAMASFNKGATLGQLAANGSAPPVLQMTTLPDGFPQLQ